jgi:hypothetical protein
MLSTGAAWEVLTLYEGNAFHCFLETQRRTALLFVVVCNRPTADRVYLHITGPFHNTDLETEGETYVRSPTNQEH